MKDWFNSHKLWIGILSIPKTIYTNFRYFPLNIAVKLPFYVRYNASVRIYGKKVFSVPVTRGMIHLGLNEHPCCNTNDKTSLYIMTGGTLYISGRLFLGNGCKIFIHSGGHLVFDDYVRSTGSTSIECFKSIKIGCNVLFSWDCLIMDGDSHFIYSPDGVLINENAPIRLGDNVWIGCRCVILKGSNVPNNSVVASCSVITHVNYKENCMIAGVPAKIVKEIGYWEA